MHYITYSSNPQLLIAELESNPDLAHYVKTDEAGDKSIGPLAKIRTYRSGDETISVVKNLPDDLTGLTNLQVLGSFYGSLPSGAPDENTQVWFADKFVSVEAQATYERITCVMVPLTDEGGNEYLRPYMVGIVG